MFWAGSEVNLNVIAMALSGFSDEHNSLWREMCSSHSMELSHPYLRAMFDFLTTESEYYNEVLVSVYFNALSFLSNIIVVHFPIKTMFSFM